MILYAIQAHANPDQLISLVELLQHPDCRIVINVDPKGQIDVQALVAHLDARGFRNAAVRIGMSPTWAGISQVYTYLELFRSALRLDADWQYLINLSGDCIPLTSQRHIHTSLDDASCEGKRVHLAFFGPPMRPQQFCEVDYDDPADPKVLIHDTMFYDRVPLLIEDPLKAVFTDREQNPLFNWHLRGSLHVTDAVLEKRLVMRRLLPFEVQSRRELFQQYELAGGRAWFIFRRDALEDLLSDPLLPTMVDLLQHFLCPDELFIQTLITNSPRFSADQIGSGNGHYQSGEPMEIRDDLADILFSSTAFFARKISFRRCPGIVGRAKEVAV